MLCDVGTSAEPTPRRVAKQGALQRAYVRDDRPDNADENSCQDGSALSFEPQV